MTAKIFFVLNFLQFPLFDLLSNLNLLCFDLSICWVDKKSQLEEDEQLAQAIQESLNVDSPPRHGNGHFPYPYGNPYGLGQAFQPMPMYYTTGYR